MANAFIKAEKVVRTMLGVLEREITLANLVWRDAGGSFAGAANDTISMRLPAYTTARTRALRATSAITIDDLDETVVDLKLTDNVYKGVFVTDEELTLDIESIADQVISPITHAVARKVEELLADTMLGATYAKQFALDPSDPYVGIVQARIALNNANVPMGDRFLAVGTNVEAALLTSDRLSLVINSGSDTALREATVGRVAGFTVVSHPALPPDVAIAAHKTAFVLSMQAPVKPDGVPWGATETFAGMSMRVIRDYDPTTLRDRLIANVFCGSSVVNDSGDFDDNDKFVPSEDGQDTPILVRAVGLELPGSVFSS